MSSLTFKFKKKLQAQSVTETIHLMKYVKHFLTAIVFLLYVFEFVLILDDYNADIKTMIIYNWT